jgi:hypothetical protein
VNEYGRTQGEEVQMVHLLLSLGACTPDSGPGAPGSHPPGSDPTGTVPTGTVPTGTVPTGSDPTAPASPLRAVSLFQAVEVRLVTDGVEVVQRNAPVVVGRDAVARVRVEVPADASTAELAVDLTAGGSTRTFTATGPAAGGASELVVPIPGDAIAANTTWSARVSVGAAVVARFPDAGEAALDAMETGPLSLVLVPFEVDGYVPDTSDAVVEGYRQAMLATYPVTDVQISVDPLQTWETLDLGGINVRVGELQESAMVAGEVDWDVYYFGLVTAASRDDWDGATGTSEDGGSEPLVRAYFASGAAFADQKSEDTLIHEMGHVHGLEHAPCDGESDVDPNFPYADGTIGVEGYDRRTGAFVPADTMDMMSYC